MTVISAPTTSAAATGPAASLPVAIATYLGRYRGLSRSHTESKPRIYLRWCADQDLDPWPSGMWTPNAHIRWSQDIRRFPPSTTSRQLTVVTDYYRTRVIGWILTHSPAEYVRRPKPPLEGLSHLQFEAILTTVRQPSDPNDFALVGVLDLLGFADLRSMRGHDRRPRQGTRPPGPAPGWDKVDFFRFNRRQNDWVKL